MMMIDDDDDNDDGGDWWSGPISEKRAQCPMLQFYPITVGVTEWIEYKQLSHLF